MTVGGGARGAKWVTLEQMAGGAVTFHHWYLMDARLWDTIRQRTVCRGRGFTQGRPLHRC